MFCYVVYKVDIDCFVGFGLCVVDSKDLEVFVCVLGVLGVELIIVLGGGLCVCLCDLFGFCVDVVWG